MMDRFGLTYHPALATGILANLDRIDLVEVVFGDALPPGIETLAAQVPVSLHGTALGLASTTAIEPRRLERLVRAVERVRPELWSEHLAFVRSDGIEIGHLAAPPRSARTIEGTLRNLESIARFLNPPAIENVATLFDPPGSPIDEAAWLAAILFGSSARLLLDLHNLHANATNFGFDPIAFIESLPLSRLAEVHVAGGRRIGTRILDDHLHAAPEPVFVLLEAVAARAPGPFRVILERDGHFPAFAELLAELDSARAAVSRGRARRALVADPAPPPAAEDGPDLEALLARLYVDDDARQRFLAAADADFDREGLTLAAASFARKRAARPRRWMDWIKRGQAAARRRPLRTSG